MISAAFLATMTIYIFTLDGFNHLQAVQSLTLSLILGLLTLLLLKPALKFVKHSIFIEKNNSQMEYDLEVDVEEGGHQQTQEDNNELIETAV